MKLSVEVIDVDPCENESDMATCELSGYSSSEASDSQASPPSSCPFHKNSPATEPVHEEARTNSSSGCPFRKRQSSAQKQQGAQTPEATGASRSQAIRFVVKDYGRGIEKKDFDRIFKPFLQADGETENLYGGTGLGLA